MRAWVCARVYVCASDLVGKAKQVKETIKAISAVSGVNVYELTFEGETHPRSRLLQA